VLLGYLHGFDALELRPALQLVLALLVVGEVTDVGDVRDEAYDEPFVLEPATEHVEDDGAAGVAQVGVGVDGRPAHVHADAAGHHGDERFLLSGQGVVELEGHGGSPGVTPVGAGAVRARSPLWAGGGTVCEVGLRARPSRQASGPGARETSCGQELHGCGTLARAITSLPWLARGSRRRARSSTRTWSRARASSLACGR